ncbi:hypothetical protein [Flavobacterium sp. U410]
MKMKSSISKNKNTLKILNKLIESGYYKGLIEDDRFELTDTYPYRLKINGKLNNKGIFELKIEHHFAFIYFSRFFLIFGTIFSILYLSKEIWIPIAFLILILLIFKLSSKITEKKAINLLLKKIFEIEIRDFE